MTLFSKLNLAFRPLTPLAAFLVALPLWAPFWGEPQVQWDVQTSKAQVVWEMKNGTTAFAQFSPLGSRINRLREQAKDNAPYDPREGAARDPFDTTGTSTNPRDTAQVAVEDLKPIHREHDHKEQVITAGAFMGAVVFLLAAMNNFNPRAAK
jgi:hypothetical protein